MNKKILSFSLLTCLCFGLASCGTQVPNVPTKEKITEIPATETSKKVTPTEQPATSKASTAEPAKTTKLIDPLEGGMKRVTKKPFGLKVSPKDSPVSPEKFSGYHTALDFETYVNEAESEVTVNAVCTGPLVMKKRATGYGGVAVQSCTIDGEKITVIYGHVKLESITTPLQTVLNAGDKLGILGKGYSTETDGERKHLHLGIHKGTSVNILGYSSSQSGLNQWLDPAKYF